MLECGSKVINKFTHEHGIIRWSIFGYSVEYKDRNGKFQRTLGCPLKQILKYWEPIEESQQRNEQLG